MLLKHEDQIDALLKQLTLKQKIGQLCQFPWPQTPEELTAYKDKIRRGEVGSVILTASFTSGAGPKEELHNHVYNVLQKIAIEESPGHIPLLYGLDVVHGHNTVFPVPLAAAAAFNDDLVEQCFADMAEEASKDGIHWTFTPMLDLARDPRWGRMVEGTGEDPYVGARFAKASVRGIQGEDFSAPDKMVACAKHFIGYGASEAGRDYHRTEISDYSLYNNYLPAFRGAIEAGVATVMTSFNDINGVPVSGSRKYLTDILRGKLGFDGFVISDWGAVGQLERQGVCQNRKEAAKMALHAGLDMDMCTGCYADHLEELVLCGQLEEAEIDLAVRRVLRVKFAKGLFQNPYYEKTICDRTQHLKDALSLAEESVVLLKNDGVLPLKKDAWVALFGPLLHERRALLGTWTLNYIEEETKTFYEAMQEKLTDGHLLRAEDQTELYDSLVVSALRADVVVLALGESHFVTGEAASLTDISLDERQVALIRKAKLAGKKVVGVIFAARPLALQGAAEYLDAIVYAWHNGTKTADAAVNLLFGDVNPSGKLPCTLPRVTGQVPYYYNVSTSGRWVNSYYGEQCQRTYQDCEATPYYPFGHGLSYTKFAYSTPQITPASLTAKDLQAGESFAVSVRVKNTGDMDGKEVVQLYIRDPFAQMMRPLRELKGFEKRMIAKGEEAEFIFTLGYDSLGYYDDKGEYLLEPGKIEVYVGGDCLAQNKAELEVL